MGTLALAAKITHVPSMYLSEFPGPNFGCRDAAINGHKEIDRRCRELGVTRYLIKPITQDELLASLRSAVAAAPTRVAKLPQRPAATRSATSLRVLVAEDNLVNQRLVAAMLKKEGHTVTIVENGRAAVDAAATAQYDVILMDVQMPEMNGFDATTAIRAHEQHTGWRTSIIALTAHAMRGDRERCLEAGMDGYVSKPVHIDDLRQALRELSGGADSGAQVLEPTA